MIVVGHNYLKSYFAAQLVGLFEKKVFSQQGSTEFCKEQATYMLFKDLLDEMEGMLKVTVGIDEKGNITCHLYYDIILYFIQKVLFWKQVMNR